MIANKKGLTLRSILNATTTAFLEKSIMLITGTL